MEEYSQSGRSWRSEGHSVKTDATKHLLVTALACTEFCWLLTAMHLLKGGLHLESFPMSWLLSCYVLAFVCERLIQRLAWSRLFRQVLVWSTGAWLTGLLVVAPFFMSFERGNSGWASPLLQALAPWPLKPTPELVTLLSGLILWGLGVRLARLKIDFAAIATAFQFGLMILILLVFTGNRWEILPKGFALIPPAFFFFALSGMSLAHIREGALESGPNKIHWFSMLLLAVGIILGLGLLFGALVRPDLLKQILIILKHGWHATVGLLWKFIIFLLSFLPEPDPAQMPPLEQSGAVASKVPEWGQILRIPDSIRSAARLIYIFLWAMVILAALWTISSSIVRWFAHRLHGDEGAEITSVTGAFREDLIRFIMKLINRFLVLKRRLNHFFLLRNEKKSIPPEVASVRQIYIQLLKWAASKGCPKDATQTPREYLHRLIEWMPEARWELAFITHQYVHVRYGPWTPSDKVLHKLRQNLRQVKQYSAGGQSGRSDLLRGDKK